MTFSLIRKFISLDIAISSACVIGYGGWVYKKSQSLPEDLRGNFFERLKEVAYAYFESKRIRHPFTAENHVDLISTLSSREFSEQSSKIEESNKIIPSSIFRYQYPQEYLYAGTLPKVYDPIARTEILDGNYIRCKEQGLLITGTRDACRCMDFINIDSKV